MAIKYEKLTGSLKRAVEEAIALEDRVGRGGRAEQKPNRPTPLEPKTQSRQMVDLGDCECLVRITRLCSRFYDDDNFSGGCKQLRDAIAAALGFKGDSKEDGIEFEYRQIKGEQGLEIEVFEK